MNTQVRFQNSLVLLAGQVDGEIIGSMRNTERLTHELYAI